MIAPPPNTPLKPLDQEPFVLCPRCGAAADAAQEYCLECGLRLPQADGLPARLGAAWERRLPWYPGDWLWPVLGLVVIAALGALVAILSTNDDHPAAAPTIVLTSPVLSSTVTTTPSIPEPTVPTTPQPTVTTPRPTPHSRPHPRPAARLVVWPPAHSGYTVVLGSIPRPSGLAAATARARRAQAGGLQRVGVLDSDRFSSLHPGYYVVFSGTYGSYSQAEAQLDRAHNAGFLVAYARRLTR